MDVRNGGGIFGLWVNDYVCGMNKSRVRGNAAATFAHTYAIFRQEEERGALVVVTLAVHMYGSMADRPAMEVEFHAV